MKVRHENRALLVLPISLLCMMLPMVLATRVFHTVPLALLYMVGYIISIISVLVIFARRLIRIKKKSVLLLALYCIILILPLINDMIQDVAINYYDPLNVVIKLVNFFVFFLLMKEIRISKCELRRFMQFIVGLSIFACFYSLIFEYKEILSIRHTINTNTLAIRSFFSNRNQYSAFLVVGLTATLYAYQLNKKNYYFVFLGIQLFCILTTFSRAALFSTIVIVGLMILQARNTKKKFFLCLLIAIAAGGVILTTGVFDYFVKNYIRWEQSGDSGRFTLWQYAWNVASINFFTGVGFYSGVDMAIEQGMWLTQFHNMFFDLLVDGGVFEVLFIIFLFCVVYKRCDRRNIDRGLLSVYRASFAAFLFYSCFESVGVLGFSYSDTLYSIFFISLPVLLSNTYQENADMNLEECCWEVQG